MSADAQTPSETHTAVDRLMKRCQVGVGGRNALNDAHDIMAECYGTLGRLQTELAAAKARIVEMELIHIRLRDSACDKIMAMTDEQITALSRLEGHDPNDEAKLGKQAVQLATQTIAIDQLRAELAAAEQRNFALAAGQCIVDGGLLGDDGGTPYCSVQRELAAAKAQIREVTDYVMGYWPLDWCCSGPIAAINHLVERMQKAEADRDQLRATVARQAEEIERLGKAAGRWQHFRELAKKYTVAAQAMVWNCDRSRTKLDHACDQSIAYAARAKSDAAIAKEPK